MCQHGRISSVQEAISSDNVQLRTRETVRPPLIAEEIEREQTEFPREFQPRIITSRQEMTMLPHLQDSLPMN